MNFNHLFFSLFSITAWFLTSIVTCEAIVNGNKAVYPICRYQATILIADHAPRCGGGIINDYFILTAAHCVIAANSQVIATPVFILAGTYDLAIAGLVVQVDRIYIPTDYSPGISLPIGDIAVLRLNKSLELHKFDLTWLQLAKDRRRNYAATDTRIAGFGWDVVFGNNSLIGENSDHHLRYAEANVLNNTECQREHPHLRITDKHLCAKLKQYQYLHITHPRGTCIGDGGGPLVGIRNIVIGVLSETVIGCSEVSTSAIYTRVSHYHQFIINAIVNRVTKNMHVFDA